MQKKNENKKNKKVVVVAAMALLLALVGISGGETYAKYASNQTDSATATVAKWGYTVSANANELFGQKYGVADTTTKLSPVGGTGVNVTGGSEVVAPGTTGSAVFTVAGAAEVLSAITVNFDIIDIALNANHETDSAKNISGYKPLNWKLTVVDSGTNPWNETYNGYDAVVAAETAINNHYNHILSGTTIILTMTLTWTWEFENSKDLEDTVFGGLVNNVLTFGTDASFGKAASWVQEGSPATDKDYYVYQNGTNNEKYTDADSVFRTKVNGSVTISQIQDRA